MSNRVIDGLIVRPGMPSLMAIPAMTYAPAGHCLVLVCKSLHDEPAGLVAVDLQSDATGDALGLASSQAQIGRMGVILLSLGGLTCATPYLRVATANGDIEVSGYMIGVDTTVSVDIPLHLLGSDCIDELASVNTVLNRIVAHRIDELSLTGETELKKKKVHICGFNKKNKGTTCTIVNVIICGKKKDKQIVEDVDEFEINLREDEHSLLAEDLAALDLSPYLGLIQDGGGLQTDAGDERIEEFNRLGQVLRALDLAEASVAPPASQ